MRCLTIFEPGTTGDERRYAEALVTKLGTRLDAPLYDLSAVDVCRPVLPNIPLPFAANYFIAVSAEHSRMNRSEEHTSGLQSLTRSTYAGFCLKKTKHLPAIQTI